MTPTWFEHATFWSGVRRATVAPQGLLTYLYNLTLEYAIITGDNPENVMVYYYTELIFFDLIFVTQPTIFSGAITFY